MLSNDVRWQLPQVDGKGSDTNKGDGDRDDGHRGTSDSSGKSESRETSTYGTSGK